MLLEICTVLVFLAVFTVFKAFFSDLLVSIFVRPCKYALSNFIQECIMGPEAPPSPVVICELLVSAVHALNTGRAADDISLCFSKFYNDTEISEARLKINSVGCNIGRRSSRKDSEAKQKHIHEIVLALIDLDWKSKNLVFAASDLDRICNVPTNIDDEVQMRMEIVSLRKKYDDLESMCNDMIALIKAMGTKIDTTNGILRNSTELHPTPAPTYSSVITEGITSDPKPPRQRQFVPVRKTAQSIHLRNIPLSPSDPRSRNNDNEENSDDPLKISEGDVEAPSWQTAKPRRPRKRLVVGTGQITYIKSVKPVKVSSVFLTRCDPETEPDEIKKYLTEENNWEIPEVVKLNTKNSGYASFRIDVKHEAENADNILESSQWPPGTYVRKFHRERKTGSMWRPSNKSSND